MSNPPRRLHPRFSRIPKPLRTKKTERSRLIAVSEQCHPTSSRPPSLPSHAELNGCLLRLMTSECRYRAVASFHPAPRNGRAQRPVDRQTDDRNRVSHEIRSRTTGKRVAFAKGGVPLFGSVGFDRACTDRALRSPGCRARVVGHHYPALVGTYGSDRVPLGVAGHDLGCRSHGVNRRCLVNLGSHSRLSPARPGIVETACAKASPGL